MASLIGEVGSAMLSGTVNSSTPILIAQFGPNPYSGPDGPCANIVTYHNGDTSNGVTFNVRVAGVHAGTASFFPILSGLTQSFQAGSHGNDIVAVYAFGSAATGGTTTTLCPISGGVTGRR